MPRAPKPSAAADNTEKKDKASRKTPAKKTTPVKKAESTKSAARNRERVAAAKAAQSMSYGGRSKTSTPDWASWNKRHTVTLRDAVYTVHNILANKTVFDELKENEDPRTDKYSNHLRTLKDWVRNAPDALPVEDRHKGKAVTEKTSIVLASFVAWVKETDPFPGLKIPPKFFELTPPTPKKSLVEDRENEALPPKEDARASSVNADADQATQPQSETAAASSNTKSDAEAPPPHGATVATSSSREPDESLQKLNIQSGREDQSVESTKPQAHSALSATSPASSSSASTAEEPELPFKKAWPRLLLAIAFEHYGLRPKWPVEKLMEESTGKKEEGLYGPLSKYCKGIGMPGLGSVSSVRNAIQSAMALLSREEIERLQKGIQRVEEERARKATRASTQT